MVSKKSIYNGLFDGFQAPVVPKAPRSLRGTSHKKSSEDSKLCAFDLLAAAANKLLQESESSTSSTGPERKEQFSITKDFVKQEEPEVKLKHVRSEHFDQGSCVESEYIPKSTYLKRKLEPTLKESPQSDNDSGLEHVSDVKTSDFLKKVGHNVKQEPFEGKNVDKLDIEAPRHGGLCDFNLANSIGEIQPEAVEKKSGDLTFRDPMESCVNTHVLNKSYSSVQLPFHKDPFPCIKRLRGNVKMGITDDDDSSFKCNHRGIKMRAFRSSRSRAVYRRIRKMLTSYRKVTPKKDYELTIPTIGETNLLYEYKKNIYRREGCQSEVASKRRKLFHHNSTYIPEERGGIISKSYEKSGSEDKMHPHVSSDKGVCSSVISHKGTFQHKDSHVKFSIKSFKVPELYVEMPETATVGSLKRTVMEAVKAFLGGEIHVGILLEGKKVRDNNRTLEQTGISQNCNLESLGFTLEPRFPKFFRPILKEPPLSPSHDTNQQPSSARSAASPMDAGFSNSSLGPHPETSLDNLVNKSQEIVPLETEVLTEEREADSKALLPVTTVKAKSLSVVPINQQPIKKSEVSQRRTRRPFSVSEVEALVEAVETVGTGRWRDVKLRAFDNANHRTYVDLKDKWKTLVHTASISPQQRRGEPVPQDLLDRVLAADGYWSQHQLKQQRKHQSEPL